MCLYCSIFMKDFSSLFNENMLTMLEKVYRTIIFNIGHKNDYISYSGVRRRTRACRARYIIIKIIIIITVMIYNDETHVTPYNTSLYKRKKNYKQKIFQKSVRVCKKLWFLKFKLYKITGYEVKRIQALFQF